MYEYASSPLAFTTPGTDLLRVFRWSSSRSQLKKPMVVFSATPILFESSWDDHSRRRTLAPIAQVLVSGVLGKVKSAGPLARNWLAEMRTQERRTSRRVKLDVRKLRI